MDLRPYQRDLLEQIHTSIAREPTVLVLPTGAGKTVIFCALAHRYAERSQQVCILVHRAELIAQVSATLRTMGVAHGCLSPHYPSEPAHLVQVASVQTLVRRLAQFPPPDLAICDEAHHVTLRTAWGTVLSAWPQAHRLGVTATPCRLSGEGLSDLFSRLIVGPSVDQLISIDALSDYQLFAPPVTYTDGLHRRMGDYEKHELEAAVNKPTITGNAVAHYIKHAHGKRAVAFCVSVNHTRAVSGHFESAGYPAASLDGTMVPAERARIICEFIAGRILVLTSCDLISEGFDLPAIEAAILLRPTQSLTVYLQQVGRCMRPIPGKVAVILDHAGNARRHGLPDDEREWTLHGRQKKNSASSAPMVSLRTCGKCFLAVKSAATICSYCGYLFPIEARHVDEVDGELVRLETIQKKIDMKREQSRASTLENLLAIERARGYAKGWAYHVHQSRKARGGW